MDFFRNTSNLSTFNKSLINNPLINSNDCSSKIALKAFNNNDIKTALFVLDNIDESCSCCSQDDNCNSVLHHLVLNCNNDECVRVLKQLLCRCDVCQFINLQNNDGSTALHLAVSKNKNDIADLLIDASADISIVNNEGMVVEKEGDGDRDGDRNRNGDGDRDSDSNENTNIFHSKDDVNKRLILNILINRNEPTTLGLNEIDIDMPFAGNKVKEHGEDEAVDVTDTVAELKEIINKLETRIKTHEEKDSSTAHPQPASAPAPASTTAPAPATTNAPAPATTTVPDTIVPDTTNALATTNASKPAPVPAPTVPASAQQTANEGGEKNDIFGGYVDNNDTDVFISKITNKIKSLNERVSIVNEIQKGGDTKLMGYRNLNTLQSKNIIKNKEVSSKKVRENSLKKSRDYILTDSSELIGGNELERMINSRKDEIHNDVLNMIQDMLNKGKISQNKKPIETNERNAKLIKAFLYKMVSEKNPQMDGMNKISLIKDMKQDDIIDMLKKLPDLDKLEKEIKSHSEKRREKKMQNKQDTSDSEPKASKPKVSKLKASEPKASKPKASKKKQVSTESSDSDITDSDMTDSDMT